MTLYGFWKYDLFPHCVGGELTGPCQADSYPGKGYWHWKGTGRCVRPFLVFSLRDGRAIQKKLDQFVREHNEKLAELRGQGLLGVTEILGATIPKW